MGTGPAGPPPRRRFGQNFLVDGATARRLVTGLAIATDEAVLEIGPGRGALTERLLEGAPKIAAVEIDRDLARSLRKRFGPERLALLEGDVLRVSFDAILGALGRAEATPLVVVGSLPYNISKPVARRLVFEHARIARALLIFQREVAERLMAEPGTRQYGPLAVLVGTAFEVRAVASLPPEAFRPRPKVHSTATLWTRRALPETAELLPRLSACLAVCFARRRQTILRNLRDAWRDEERARRALLSAGIDPALRAEAVSPDALRALARRWP